MTQLMKSRNNRYGEHQSAEKLGIEVHTMGDGSPGTRRTRNRRQDGPQHVEPLRGEVALG